MVQHTRYFPSPPRSATIIGVLLLACAAGCETPILTPNEPRSQYDRFDAVREQRAPSYVYDEYGVRRPNIRQRLLVGD